MLHYALSLAQNGNYDQSEVWGLGFGVWGLGFGVWGLGFGVWGLGFGVWGARTLCLCLTAMQVAFEKLTRTTEKTWGSNSYQVRAPADASSSFIFLYLPSSSSSSFIFFIFLYLPLASFIFLHLLPLSSFFILPHHPRPPQLALVYIEQSKARALQAHLHPQQQNPKPLPTTNPSQQNPQPPSLKPPTPNASHCRVCTQKHTSCWPRLSR